MIVTATGRAWIEKECMYKSIQQTSMSHILISVTGDEKYRVNLENAHKNPYCKRILVQYFEDIEEKEDGYILFNEVHANAILQIVDESIFNVSAILIHCDAGISRSVGIASALSKLLNRIDDKYFKGYPNFHIYSTILKYYSDNRKKFPNIYKYYYEKNPIIITRKIQ